MIPDGHVITRWGQGWSYDGDTVGGRFNGEGILTTNTATASKASGPTAR